MNTSPQTGLCLLVEDQPHTRDWMLGVLATAFPGLRVDTAGTLKAAQQWLDTNGTKLTLANTGKGTAIGLAIPLRATVPTPDRGLSAPPEALGSTP